MRRSGAASEMRFPRLERKQIFPETAKRRRGEGRNGRANRDAWIFILVPRRRELITSRATEMRVAGGGHARYGNAGNTG